MHAVDRQADLDVVVGEHTAHVYGLGGRDETYSTADEQDEAWQAETVEILGELLQGPLLGQTVLAARSALLNLGR